MQVKPTVTSLLYHPAGLAARSASATIAGSVLSMLTKADASAVLPALSLVLPLTSCSLPSAFTVCSEVQSLTPDRVGWSAQEKATCTSVLFQPWLFATGVWSWLMVGDWVSTFTVMVLGASTLPATSTLQYLTVWVPSVLSATLLPDCCAPPSTM